MNKRTLILLAMTVFIGSLSAWAAEAPDMKLFEKASQSYRDGNFKEAIADYEQLASNHPDEAVFFYNLGNSYFRAGKPGPSILAYERALVRDPRDHDARANLNYARGLLEYQVEDKRNWYLKAFDRLLKMVTLEEAYLAAAFFYFLFMTAWVYVIYFRRGLPWGPVRKTFLALMVFSFLFLAAKHLQIHMMGDAIVLAKEAEVRYGPSPSDQVAFRLGEGLKVQVVDRRPGWSRVILASGESGWVSDDQIGVVHDESSILGA